MSNHTLWHHIVLAAEQDELCLGERLKMNMLRYSPVYCLKHALVRSMKLLLVFAVAIGVVSPAAAVNIAWVSFHSADNMPSTGAANLGFTQAPDIGYTNLLSSNGHTVTRVVTSGDPDVSLLNTFDLVIISRSVPSGDYELDAETAEWHSLSTPTMILGGYIIRGGAGGGARLGYTTGETIPDTAGAINLAVPNPAHPIFAGVQVTGGTTVNPYTDGLAQMPVGAMSTQRGISVNTNPVAGGGTVLASVATAGDPAENGMVIGQWAPGSRMGNNPADVTLGHRLVFLTGSREHAATTEEPSSAEMSGILDLSATGRTMFLNAVNYTAGLGKILAGDVNLNGVVDINDYAIIRDNFNGTGKMLATGDLNGDTVVNFLDFRIWKNNRPAGVGADVGLELALGHHVPEPGSLVLALLGVAGLVRITARRRG
jgi:hypothetical protein